MLNNRGKNVKLWETFNPLSPPNASAQNNTLQNFKHIIPLTFFVLQPFLEYDWFPVPHHTLINFMLFIESGYQWSRQEVYFGICGLDQIRDLGAWK